MNNKEKEGVIVTGCLGGIGQAINYELKKKNNFYIIGLDLEEKPDSESLKNIDKYIPCDLNDPEIIFNKIEFIFSKYINVKHLINNAGVMRNDMILNLNWNKEDYLNLVQEWDKTIDINLRASFGLSVCFSNNLYLKRLEGSIIHISSISSNGNAGQSSYSASKGGLRSLSKTLSKELGNFGIRSNVIIPGFIKTKAGSIAISEKNLRKKINQTPLKRLGKPSEVAEIINTLIENEFLNGCEINIDGGLTL